MRHQHMCFYANVYADAADRGCDLEQDCLCQEVVQAHRLMLELARAHSGRPNALDVMGEMVEFEGQMRSRCGRKTRLCERWHDVEG